MDSRTHSTTAVSTAFAPVFTNRPLFVDLDGTLIGTDLLHEGFLRALKCDPTVLVKTPGWIKQGLASFKQEIARRAPVDAATLPYREALVVRLIAERARGRAVILATASPEQWARPVAEYLGCFDDVIASDATHNRKSSSKLAAIREWCQARGHAEFDYCGDSSADRKLWSASQIAILVGRGTRFRAGLTLQGVACEDIAVRTASLTSILNMLRPASWLRDVACVLGPLPFVRGFVDWSSVAGTTGAFIAASAANFIVNDLFDLDADRQQPRQQHRPLAAGLWPIPQAIALAAVLFVISGALGALSGSTAVLTALVGYVTLSTLYSWWLKPLPVFGLGALASLSLLRVIAGFSALRATAPEWVLVALGLVFVAVEVATFAKNDLRADGRHR